MPGATLLLLLLPPTAGGSGSTGDAGAAQVVAPFGWAFFFAGDSAPTSTLVVAGWSSVPEADDFDAYGVDPTLTELQG